MAVKYRVSSAVFALLLVSGIGAEVAVAPVFMWSSVGYFTGSQCTRQEVDSIVSAEELGWAVKHLIGTPQKGMEHNPLQSLVAPASDRPEAVLAFVYSKPSILNADIQTTLVEEYLQTKPCLSVPFVDMGKTTSAQALTAAIRTNPQAQVVDLQLGSSCDSVLASLGGSSLFSNGVTDLVLVHVSGKVEGSCAKKVIELASSKADRLIFAMTAESQSMVTDLPCEIDPAWHGASRMLLEDTIKATNTTAGRLQYISTPILMGLMLMFVMLMFLLIGVSCLMSIDAPQRFATESLPVPKEY
jgi:hypothetical protein